MIPIKPTGETGLTARIMQIAFMWSLAQTFRRSKWWVFGNTKVAPVFQTLHASIEMCWFVEILRILDKREFGQPGKKNHRENLTVRLCHDRFQASAVPLQKAKDEEQKLFEAIFATYDSSDMQTIRDRHMFHLDYEEQTAGLKNTGPIDDLTPNLIRWLLTVLPWHDGQQDYTWHIHGFIKPRGKRVGRDYRRMMLTYFRIEQGLPMKRKRTPKNIEMFKHWRRGVEIPPVDE